MRLASSARANFRTEATMQIHFLCTSWGNELPVEEFVRKVRNAGYDGVEMSLPNDDEALKRRILDSISIAKPSKPGA